MASAAVSALMLVVGLVMVLLVGPTHKQIKLMRLMQHIAFVFIIVNAVPYAVDADDA